MAQLNGPTGETGGGVSKRWWLGVAAVAMVGAAVVAIPLSVHRATGSSGTAAATPSGFIGYACGFTRGLNEPMPTANNCERQAADQFQRSAPDPALDPGSDRVKEVRAVVTEALACAGRSSCATPPPPHTAELTDAAAAFDALRAHKFADPVVHIASASDPAPVGALMYAVRIDRACVIGFLEQVPDGAGSLTVAGPLPNGACLG